MKSAPLLICLAGLCSAAVTAAPQPMTGQAWLAALPPLPATAEAAYAQWTDISGILQPGAAFDASREGMKGELMRLARSVPRPAGTNRRVSPRDQELLGQISEFPGAAVLQQRVAAAGAARIALEQKWRADLDAIERRRQQERSALPACHNEAGAPSQIAIRDVEERYAQQRIALAARYLEQFRPLVEQMRAAVAPRIEHGDLAMAAWQRLRNADMKAQLAPAARGAESTALVDVGSVQAYIEGISKLAARPVMQHRALRRVYAQATGC